MPHWLRKFLFGAQTLSYVALCASGRTFTGTVDACTVSKDANLLRACVVHVVGKPGDPCLFVQYDVVGETRGLLGRFPRVHQALRLA